MRKVILRQGQSPGDVLTMTRAIHDLKESHPEMLIDVRTPCPAIFENNPAITSLEDKEAKSYSITYDEIHNSHWKGLHFSDAFRMDIEKKMLVKIKKTGDLPLLYLSDEEKGWTNQVEAEYGWKGPFWLLNAGWKLDNELKRYCYWQEVVKLLNERWGGRVRIVQIGEAAHKHPKLEGVYDLIGKTDLRQLVRLAYWSHGTLGPISLQFEHLPVPVEPNHVLNGEQNAPGLLVHPPQSPSGLADGFGNDACADLHFLVCARLCRLVERIERGNADFEQFLLCRLANLERFVAQLLDKFADLRGIDVLPHHQRHPLGRKRGAVGGQTIRNGY